MHLLCVYVNTSEIAFLMAQYVGSLIKAFVNLSSFK